MIISRTPFRISFFGGGTDYPAWFKDNKGSVLVTTIDKYCYLTCRYLPQFFDHKTRVVWSKIERVQKVIEIEHPAVREILTYLNIEDGVEIHHDGDLPARAGLGSSSAFAVGLLNALSFMKGCSLTKTELAKYAIFIEQELISDNVGSQDQVSTAFGGLNQITFDYTGEFTVKPIPVTSERLALLHDHLMLIFTGFSRTASEVAGEQIKVVGQKQQELRAIQQNVGEGIRILSSDTEILDFGRLLHESWQIKRSITDKISNPKIDEIYDMARNSGAIGGKLLGAGGGGFMLIFAEPDKHPVIKEKLKDFLHVPFEFETRGSQIIFSDHSA